MKFPAKLFLKMQQKRYMADLEKELQKRSDSNPQVQDKVR